MTGPCGEQPVASEAHARLDALRMLAAGAGLDTALSYGTLTVAAPPAEREPARTDEVSCRPRPDDGGRLWFFDGDGNPIAEADHLTDTVVHLGGTLRRNPRPDRTDLTTSSA